MNLLNQQEERNLKDATMANHVSSILYVIKFQNQASAPQYKDVPLLSQLRSIATQLQVRGESQRNQSKEDLIEEGRWLDW